MINGLCSLAVRPASAPRRLPVPDLACHRYKRMAEMTWLLVLLENILLVAKKLLLFQAELEPDAANSLSDDLSSRKPTVRNILKLPNV
jgi:hypothetical protein